MAFIADTAARPVVSPLPDLGAIATGLARWLIALDARYREARRMEELTDEERRDMGMPCRIERQRLPDTGW